MQGSRKRDETMHDSGQTPPYITGYKGSEDPGRGHHRRRRPNRPFDRAEEVAISTFSGTPTAELYGMLPHIQDNPRLQRLVQEGIESRRAHGEY